MAYDVPAGGSVVQICGRDSRSRRTLRGSVTELATASGARLSATIRAFSSQLHRRRRSGHGKTLLRRALRESIGTFLGRRITWRLHHGSRHHRQATDPNNVPLAHHLRRVRGNRCRIDPIYMPSRSVVNMVCSPMTGSSVVNSCNRSMARA